MLCETMAVAVKLSYSCSVWLFLSKAPLLLSAIPRPTPRVHRGPRSPGPQLLPPSWDRCSGSQTPYLIHQTSVPSQSKGWNPGVWAPRGRRGRREGCRWLEQGCRETGCLGSLPSLGRGMGCIRLDTPRHVPSNLDLGRTQLSWPVLGALTKPVQETQVCCVWGRAGPGGEEGRDCAVIGIFFPAP